LFEHQRVSYRGTIPPAAIQLFDLRSQPIAALVNGLSGASAIDVGGLLAGQRSCAGGLYW